MAENVYENYDLKLEDGQRMHFVRVKAENAVDALLEALKKAEMPNPMHVLRIREGGKVEALEL